MLSIVSCTVVWKECKNEYIPIHHYEIVKLFSVRPLFVAEWILFHFMFERTFQCVAGLVFSVDWNAIEIKRIF